MRVDRSILALKGHWSIRLRYFALVDLLAAVPYTECRQFRSGRWVFRMNCPRCNSSHLELLGVDKQGFSLGKAAVGGLLLGPVGC